MIKKRYLKCYAVTLIILAVGLTIATSCKGYRDFILRDAVAKFSFEVPLHYGSLSVDRTSSDITSIFGSLPSKTAPSDIYFIITAQKQSPSFPDYLSLLEYNLKISESNGKKTGGFELKERSIKPIVGIKGEQIIYSYTRQQDPNLNISKVNEPFSSVAFELYFENNDVLYSIIFKSIVEEYEKAKADFEHVIQTFKILE